MSTLQFMILDEVVEYATREKRLHERMQGRLDEIRETYVTRMPGQHYLEVFEVQHEDDACWGELPAEESPDGYEHFYDFQVHHARECAARSPGDGSTVCSIEYELYEVGRDAFDLHAGIFESWPPPPFYLPIIHVAETYGYFEPEYESWIEKGFETPKAELAWAWTRLEMA